MAVGLTSLKGWLHDNPVGAVLGGVCGLLLLIFLVLTIMSALPLSIEPVNDASGAGANLELPALSDNKPLDTYAVITQRPLFNSGRQPDLDDVAEDEEGMPVPEEDGERPEVELAGVVITPSLRMVTLKRKDNALSLVAFEGKPIEADFGTWRVSRIQPRAATLTSAGGEELQLELKVHDARIEPPVQAVKRETAAESSGSSASQSTAAEPLSRAEEIRQRIAERREELKREAEQAEQEAAEDKPPKPSYQQVMQSLITRKKQSKGNGEQ